MRRALLLKQVGFYLSVDHVQRHFDPTDAAANEQGPVSGVSCFLWLHPLTLGIPLLFCTQVDPMFQKTAASFDECSTAGVFLSTLHCPDYRSELLFPTDIQTLSSGEPPELPDLGWVEVTDLKGESSAASYQSSSVIREVSVYNHG